MSDQVERDATRGTQRRPDPRVARTRIHVLETARRMYSSREAHKLNFGTLAEAAEVSRKTLQSHWGTIENLLVDALAYYQEVVPEVTDESPRERLRRFLLMIRDGNANPIVAAASIAMVAERKQSQAADGSEPALNAQWLAAFNETVAPATERQYAQLVGAVVFQEFFGPETPSDEFIDELVESGAVILGFPD
ncbi:TetR/AcrR family transcriptional regulator [Glaciihabitans sp. dw_435]|uniref:TetR/AcrR family transcriptional regulator n=1 Tax=Glaciihabitans sp. dw_435 TaxID=2720081 RepID=UPI001BD49250|nr:TetR/AcrR family transcriptional regulator [Glaciihabitans sp. dw_435]